MSTGYERIYEGLKIRLASCNLAEAASRLGLQLLPDGSAAVFFLGREYVISSKGIWPTDGRPVNVNFLSVLAYYTLSQGAGDADGDFVPLACLANAAVRFGSNLQWVSDPLSLAFRGRESAFDVAMVRLGGRRDGPSGRHIWSLAALPKIHMQIEYEDEDDEFPCEIHILFSRRASRFLDFECLAFLEGCFVKVALGDEK